MDDNLSSQIEVLNNRISELVEQKTKLNSTIERLESDHAKLEADNLVKNEETEQKINDLEEEVGLLGEQLALARKQGDEWIEEYERENKRAGPHDLKLEHEKLLSQIDRTTTNTEKMKRDLKAALERHEAQKEECAINKSKMSKEIEQIKLEVEALKSDLEISIAEKDMLESEIELIEPETLKLKKKVEDLENNRGGLNLRLQELSPKNSDKQLKSPMKFRSNTENGEISKFYNKNLEKRSKSLLAGSSKDGNTNISKEPEELHKQEIEVLNKKLFSQKDTYEKEIKSMQKEIKSLLSKIRDMDNENQSISSNRKSLTLEKASLVKEKGEMQYQVENLQKESERYRKKTSSITELESRIRKLQKEKDVAIEQKSQKIIDLQNELQISNDKIKEITKEKNLISKERLELQRKYLFANEMKETLESDIKAEKEHIKAMEVEIQNITDQLQTERRDHQAKSEQLSIYEDELQVTREQCNRHREEIEQLQETLNHSSSQTKKFGIMRRNNSIVIDDDDIRLLFDENSKLKNELIENENQLKELQDSAQNEISTLKNELNSAREQILLMGRLKMTNTTNSDIDIEEKLKDKDIQELQKIFEDKDMKSHQKYQTELQSEKKRYEEKISLMSKEIRYLKSRCIRETGFRADLSYQKRFITTLLCGTEKWEYELLQILSNSGPNKEYDYANSSKLSQKFRSVVTSIIASLENIYNNNSNYVETFK
ncbi:7938_t:CDS:10 [Entrophospora sp. SA101]|nr:7938_t:CDS:10 [Entrophospora sp. SA101]